MHSVNHAKLGKIVLPFKGLPDVYIVCLFFGFRLVLKQFMWLVGMMMSQLMVAVKVMMTLLVGKQLKNMRGMHLRMLKRLISVRHFTDILIYIYKEKRKEKKNWMVDI